jgi:PleD family two-component response regulator
MENSVPVGQTESKDNENSLEIFKLFDTSPAIESLLDSVGNKCIIPRKYIIIGLSASSDSLTMEEALHAGMNEFLSKPLSVSNLKICFNRFLPLLQQQSMDTT